MSKKYTITHSNYTVKKKHKLLSDKTIYENDYMVTTNLGGFDSDSIPYGEGNFRFKYNNEKNLKRKHKYGNWLKNTNCKETSENDCTLFSLENMPEVSSEITSETKIVVKPNKNNLLDYVYYGNCEEMIRVSVENIIKKFPAELYVSDRQITYETIDNTIGYLGGKNMCVIDNPFEIDITTLNTNFNNDTYHNPLRFFAESYNKYRIIDKDDISTCVTDWNVDVRKKKCFNNGDLITTITLNGGTVNEIVIKEYYFSGVKILVTDKKNIGKKIRPTDIAINNAFESMDLFDKFLLNSDSKPLYTINIDVPQETDTGLIYVRRKYSWPITNYWNLDISGMAFNYYINSLLEVAIWYDENKVDNLWRRMTHDSIKNMDRTHTDTYRNEDNDDYMIGTSNIHGLFNAYGRQFDDIKQSIDNIKSVNNVTYDENNNLPDYFLTDQLELSGWEVKNTVETLDANVNSGILYAGISKQYNIIDANLAFLRNLKINSKSIFSKKGTKNGIETILSLFGYNSYDWAKKRYEATSESLKDKKNGKALKWNDLEDSYKNMLFDYTLNEYVVVAKNTSNDIVYEDDILPTEQYYEYINKGDDIESNIELYGLPVRVVYLTTLVDGIETVKKYLIPWFDKTDSLYGSPYFQMFGGWGKTNVKKVVPNDELYPNVNKIESISGFTIYDETKKYLKIAFNTSILKDLLIDNIENGDIYYVNDISDYSDCFTNSSLTNVSNYFIINDKNNSSFYGENEEGKIGWENIPLSDISCEEGPNKNGYKVIYLESLIESNKGNNPHIGYGQYDNGESYIDYFRHIFKGVIEEEMFTDEAYDCETGDILNEIKNNGFTITDEIIDNMKVWYFTDKYADNIYKLKKTTKTAYDDEMNEVEVNSGYEEVSYINKINVGKNAYNNGEVGFKSELSAFNLETQENNSNEEASANSIINIKKLKLSFNETYGEIPQFREYLETCILPYVKQMIPSTTIFEYEIL